MVYPRLCLLSSLAYILFIHIAVQHCVTIICIIIGYISTYLFLYFGKTFSIQQKNYLAIVFFFSFIVALLCSLLARVNNNHLSIITKHELVLKEKNCT